MRCLVFALAVVCAILSGWTAAVAQARDQGMAFAARAHHAAHSLPATEHRAHAPTGRAGDCGHAGTCLHPMLCAACLAIGASAQGLAPPRRERSAIRPLVDLPLASHAPRPASPPPKTRLSTG